jgi:hypothetical protein
MSRHLAPYQLLVLFVALILLPSGCSKPRETFPADPDVGAALDPQAIADASDRFEPITLIAGATGSVADTDSGAGKVLSMSQRHLAGMFHPVSPNAHPVHNVTGPWDVRFWTRAAGRGRSCRSRSPIPSFAFGTRFAIAQQSEVSRDSGSGNFGEDFG